MIARLSLMATLCSLTLAGGAFAQTVGSETERNVDQQQRIEQGLKSGQLSTGEAARLENGEARINRMESNALKDGNLSPAEKARIQGAQNQESRRIYADKHNGVAGNPESASSERMQKDVQRNVNQQKRIDQGIRSGSLSRRDVGELERGQAKNAHREARAGADGNINAHEQRRIQQADNRQSRRIYREKQE